MECSGIQSSGVARETEIETETARETEIETETARLTARETEIETETAWNREQWDRVQ